MSDSQQCWCRPCVTADWVCGRAVLADKYAIQTFALQFEVNGTQVIGLLARVNPQRAHVITEEGREHAANNVVNFSALG